MGIFQKPYSSNEQNCISRKYGKNSRKYKRAIMLYDLDGMLMGSFDNLMELSKYTGNKINSLSCQICRGKTIKRKYKAEWIIIELTEEELNKKYEKEKLRRIANERINK